MYQMVSMIINSFLVVDIKMVKRGRVNPPGPVRINILDFIQRMTRYFSALSEFQPAAPQHIQIFTTVDTIFV